LVEDNGEVNLVLPDDEKGVVRGVREGEAVFFTAERSESRYRWISELKFEQAQRIVNKYAAEISRVGLDESEWLRRWAL
jgi:hypothetical protein